MPVPLEFLRGVMGALCVMFAHFFGRAVARRYAGIPKARVTSWGLRTAITGAAVAIRHRFDTVDAVVLVLAAVSFGAGMWDELRPKRQEDLSKDMFPKE